MTALLSSWVMSAPCSSQPSTFCWVTTWSGEGEVGTRLKVLLRDRVVITVRRQVASDQAAAALHERNAVAPQDLLDLVLLVLKGEFEGIFQQHVGLTHTDGEVELERYRVFPKIHGLNGDRLTLRLDPAGKWPPNRRDVEIAVDDLLHLIIGLIFRLQVCVMGNDVKLEIVDDAVLHQRLANAEVWKTPIFSCLSLGSSKLLKSKPLSLR
jgi:hypothetical protein